MFKDLMGNSLFKGKTIIISAGGTGGHVYPALVVARELIALGAKVEWLGTESGIESKLVPKENINLNTIFIQGIRKNGINRLIKSPFILLNAVLQAIKIVKSIKPDVFIGFGGFVSGPGALAAKIKGIPVIVHEQNAAIGFTNKIVSKWAKKTLLAFPIDGCKGIVIGNPIRKYITELPEPSKRVRQIKPFRILVVGGSLGAKAINEVIPGLLSQIDYNDFEITHQAGKTTFNETKNAYKELGLLNKVKLFEYIDNMADVYSNADLVIARSGALTISEISSVGVAAIFIPLPNAVDNHQFLNAKFLQNAKAAKIIEQKDLTVEELKKNIVNIVNNNRLLEMANIAREHSHKDALNKMIVIIKEVVGV